MIDYLHGENVMRISSKGRYAVRIMAEIAKQKDYVSVADIASNQQISVKYIEQIINKLTKAKLLISLRGSRGGYKLSKPACDISVAEILEITGDAPMLAPCLKGGINCARKSECDTIGCWEMLNLKIYNFLKKISLNDIINKKF